MALYRVSIGGGIGDASTSDVLSGKTFSSQTAGSGATGTMENYGNKTVDCGNTSTDDSYFYTSIPNSGYYDKNSKIRMPITSLPSIIFDNPVKIRLGINTNSQTSNWFVLGLRLPFQCFAKFSNPVLPGKWESCSGNALDININSEGWTQINANRGFGVNFSHGYQPQNDSPSPTAYATLVIVPTQQTDWSTFQLHRITNRTDDISITFHFITPKAGHYTINPVNISYNCSKGEEIIFSTSGSFTGLQTYNVYYTPN